MHVCTEGVCECVCGTYIILLRALLQKETMELSMRILCPSIPAAEDRVPSSILCR